MNMHNPVVNLSTKPEVYGDGFNIIWSQKRHNRLLSLKDWDFDEVASWIVTWKEFKILFPKLPVFAFWKNL